MVYNNGEIVWNMLYVYNTDFKQTQKIWTFSTKRLCLYILL